MDRDQVRAYCLTKPGAWLDEPWDGDEVVKVGDKIFAFLGAPVGDEPAVGLKCGATKDDADELRRRYPADVTVSAYIGRYGWNRIRIGASVPDDELRDAIDASYADVVARLPRRQRP